MAEINIDPEVKYKIAQLSGGESIRLCLQCGRCAAVCPVRVQVKDFSPLKIVRTIMLGSKSLSTILSTETTWRCLTCAKACVDVCPSNVEFPESVEAIRKMAVEEGITEYVLTCKRCGKEFTTTPAQKFLIDQLPDEIEIDEEKYGLCPDCRMDTLRIE